MRIHVTNDKELATFIRKALKENEGYCPCIYQSKGKQEYACICEDFRLNKKVGETCHCGLYIKDED
jgi:ferredoxin-thioredoxin reductase catalytic subunit